MTTPQYTIELGRRGIICIDAFPDLRAQSRAAADAYCRADDGGYTGTTAARAYHAEIDAVVAEYSRRCRTILAAAFGLVF